MYNKILSCSIVSDQDLFVHYLKLKWISPIFILLEGKTNKIYSSLPFFFFLKLKLLCIIDNIFVDWGTKFCFPHWSQIGFTGPNSNKLSIRPKKQNRPDSEWMNRRLLLHIFSLFPFQ